MTTSKFSQEIENIVKEEQVDYLEAVCLFCQKFEIDFESVPKFLTPTMKDKIECAAIEKNYRL